MIEFFDAFNNDLNENGTPGFSDFEYGISNCIERIAVNDNTVSFVSQREHTYFSSLIPFLSRISSMQKIEMSKVFYTTRLNVLEKENSFFLKLIDFSNYKIKESGDLMKACKASLFLKERAFIFIISFLLL